MRPAALAFTLAALLSAAPAQAAGDPVAGEVLAERFCTDCHAVAMGEASPVPEASPLASFAAKWPLEHLEEALAEGIVVGHAAGAPMPEFRFEPRDIDDLLAYLRSLTEK